MGRKLLALFLSSCIMVIFMVWIFFKFWQCVMTGFVEGIDAIGSWLEEKLKGLKRR